MVEVLLPRVELVAREDAAGEQRPGPFEVLLRLVVADLAELDSALGLGELERRRVRSDREERLSMLDPVAHLDEAARDDPRDLRLDLDLLIRDDLPDRERLVDDRAAHDLDGLHLVLLGRGVAAIEEDRDRGAYRQRSDHYLQRLAHERLLGIGPS